MTTSARVPFVPSPAPGDPLTDDEVVQRVRAGETGLFELLMRRYNRRLYRVARAILRDEAEAEDVMQHAYVAAYVHLDQYQGRALFSTWLTRIAVHEALARLRKRGREVVAGQAWSDPREDMIGLLRSGEPDPERQVLEGEMRFLLESAIESLPLPYRSVFVLREVEGLSTLEAAACLGVSADVVKTRLHRARALLRESLYQRVGSTGAVYPFAGARCDRIVSAVLAEIGALAD
jgi:RNA polymerase sigma-70 factor (ECF subfamily)